MFPQSMRKTLKSAPWNKSLMVKLDKWPNSYFLSPQLGFGSFLGIIGAHLIENKRQMVRGFILPLCIEITFSAVSTCLCSHRTLLLNCARAPITFQHQLQLDYVVKVKTWAASPTQTQASPTSLGPEKLRVAYQSKCPGASGAERCSQK